jgi:hypothetical protein
MLEYIGLNLVHDPNPNENVWRRLALGACLIEVVVAILLMFNRPDFFDVRIEDDLTFYSCFYLFASTYICNMVFSKRSFLQGSGPLLF